MIYALYKDDELLDFSYSLDDLANRTGRKLSSFAMACNTCST